MQNVGKVVAEIGQVDYLNLFINSLNEEERGKELEFMRPQNDEELIRKEHEQFMSRDINGVAA